MFTWGSNDRGQLGLPAAAEVAQQLQVRRGSGGALQAVTCGRVNASQGCPPLVLSAGKTAQPGILLWAGRQQAPAQRPC